MKTLSLSHPGTREEPSRAQSVPVPNRLSLVVPTCHPTENNAAALRMARVMQRRGGGQRVNRQSSAVENGNGHCQPAGGQLCPGGDACLGASGSSGYTCGCIRKSSPLRRALYSLRFSLRRAASRASRQKGAVGAYLAACVFLLWCGLHVSALLRGGGGGDAGGGAVEPRHHQGVERRHHQRELLSADEAIIGYRDEDIGPRLAYGIMVYQRKGYSPQKTLDQFGRMFNALYDKENT